MEKIDFTAENILYVSESGYICKLVSFAWLFGKYGMILSEVQKYLESGELVERGKRAFYLYKTNKK